MSDKPEQTAHFGHTKVGTLCSRHVLLAWYEQSKWRLFETRNFSGNPR